MYVAARFNELSLMTAVNSHTLSHIHAHKHMNAQQTDTHARAFSIRAKMRSFHCNQKNYH